MPEPGKSASASAGNNENRTEARPGGADGNAAPTQNVEAAQPTAAPGAPAQESGETAPPVASETSSAPVVERKAADDAVAATPEAQTPQAAQIGQDGQDAPVPQNTVSRESREKAPDAPLVQDKGPEASGAVNKRAVGLSVGENKDEKKDAAAEKPREVIYVDEQGNPVPKPPEPDKMLAEAERLINWRARLKRPCRPASFPCSRSVPKAFRRAYPVRDF